MVLQLYHVIKNHSLRLKNNYHNGSSGYAEISRFQVLGEGGDWGVDYTGPAELLCTAISLECLKTDE